MDLSIVIVNWNTGELLRRCLQSLPAATGALTVETIVVDNASGDGSAELVESEFGHCHLLRAGANLGFAGGNNLALKQATGRAVLLLNPDTICPPDSIVRLYRFMNSCENLAAVGPRLLDDTGQPTITWGFFPRARYHWLGFLDPRRFWLRGRWSRRVVAIPHPDEPSQKVEYVLGACFLIPRDALERVGTLDDGYFLYFEETDWCWRARQAGLDVWYCAEAEIVHLEGKAAEQVSLFSIRQFQKSYRRFVTRNYGAGRVWQFRLAQFAEYGLKALLRSLALGDRARNQALALGFRERARAQLQGEIRVTPPR